MVSCVPKLSTTGHEGAQLSIADSSTTNKFTG
eukprot:SAG31_NODE_42566_length_271_cov_0.593023_1_plen_31_part_10